MPPTPTTFRFRDIAVPAFGPSLVNAIGHGAVMPVLALHARSLGASVSTAALVVGLMALGMMLASLPAGAVVARIGERRMLLVAGAIDAAAMVAAGLTRSVLGLSIAILVSGMTWTAFLIARQGYMIEAVPVTHRARAMSMLGGMFRIGVMIGPLLGALLVHGSEVRVVFFLAAGMSIAAGLLAFLMPDLTSDGRAEQKAAGHRSVGSVLREHRTVLLTVGTAVIVIGVSRSVRASLLPLWADHIGLSASTTSLLFALAAAVDIALFLPGGWLMDKRGRALVAVPVVVASAAGCLLLPLTSTALGLAGVMVLIACGNGFGSGIVMTLGADLAPDVSRSQFLGGWRLCGDIGNTGGPLLVAAVAAVAPLALASVTIGGLLLGGSWWVRRWTHRLDVRRTGTASAVSRS